MWRAIGITVFGCCVQKSPILREYNGKQLYLSIAPEPSDIFFENLAVTGRRKVQSRLFQALMTMIALFISCVVVYCFDRSHEDELKVNDGYYWMVSMNSLATALIIVFINVILGHIIRKSASYEKYVTITKYTAAVALRLTIC